jgi:chromate reductase, NAD(P)H dehydrogenase (quinone)
MYYIPMLLGTVRMNSESAKVARFAAERLGGIPGVQTEILDLRELNLPMMEERLRFHGNPPSAVLQLSNKARQADAIVIVTPEYNGGYPGVLKNALDYLRDEFRHKPFGIITVSSAHCGGIFCLTSLRQVVLHQGGVPIPASFSVTRVQDVFTADGSAIDAQIERRAQVYFGELMWFTEALAARRYKDIDVSECSREREFLTGNR